MKKATQKLKVYQEEVKQRHVSHWDWDYMTTSDIDSMIDLDDTASRKERKKASCFEIIFRMLCTGFRSISSVERSR